MFWPAVACRFGYHCAFAERTLLLARRIEFSAVIFETLFSWARRSASASEIGWYVVSVICCAPANAGAASSEATINFLRMFSWAPWPARHRAEPGFPSDARRAGCAVRAR